MSKIDPAPIDKNIDVATTKAVARAAVNAVNIKTNFKQVVYDTNGEMSKPTIYTDSIWLDDNNINKESTNNERLQYLYSTIIDADVKLDEDITGSDLYNDNNFDKFTNSDESTKMNLVKEEITNINGKLFNSSDTQKVTIKRFAMLSANTVMNIIKQNNIIRTNLQISDLKNKVLTSDYADLKNRLMTSAYDIVYANADASQISAISNYYKYVDEDYEETDEYLNYTISQDSGSNGECITYDDSNNEIKYKFKINNSNNNNICYKPNRLIICVLDDQAPNYLSNIISSNDDNINDITTNVNEAKRIHNYKYYIAYYDDSN